MGLAEYNRKRNFGITSEPPGDAPAKPRADGALSFVIQKHAATRLHYDFRLELNGVLLSWSVPKGPSLDPTVKRLAMHVEDHPLAYGGFEGIIPKGQYGGGTVLLWDRGTWVPQEDPVAGYAKGNLKFILKGEKLHGGFALIRLGGRRAKEEGERAWLLIKEKDAAVRPGGPELTDTRPESVATGRSLEEIAADKSSVWHSKPSHVDLAGTPGAREAPLPSRPKPPRPAKRSKAPDGDDWLHEIAVPGVRVVARKRTEQGAAVLRSRDRAAREGRQQGQADRRRRPHAASRDAAGRRHRRALGLPGDDSKLGTSCSTSPTSTAAT
jgi:bifunctional non-homologous end joining protein LigD